jgi:D-3-phosphoglycerate dehydrogenase
MTMYKVRVLNNISALGLDKLPSGQFEIGADIADPDAILVRSADMHAMEFSGTLKAVGRAGAGVNNIPVEALSARGVPVFNAPGANANAVKELVVAGLLLACRNICQAWEYARHLSGSDEEVHRAVESGKKKFSGTELPGNTVGVVGLGAIGRSVANLCLDLGMNVVGFDPKLTVAGAWQLSSSVSRDESLESLLRKVDFVTFHVPLNDSTRNMINADTVRLLKDGATLLNFARDGIIDDRAVCDAMASGKLRAYVTDFPNNALLKQDRVIALPHLGASTAEAEINCAVMVAEQVRDFLENGNVRNSVNFPNVLMPRGTDYRLVVANANVPNMLGQISTAMAEASLNIHDMINQSKGELAYTVVDTDSPIPDSVVNRIGGIEGVLMARRL